MTVGHTGTPVFGPFLLSSVLQPGLGWKALSRGARSWLASVLWTPPWTVGAQSLPLWTATCDLLDFAAL